MATDNEADNVVPLRYNPFTIDVAEEESELQGTREMGSAVINLDFKGQRVAQIKLRWYDGLSARDPLADEPEVGQQLDVFLSQETDQGIESMEQRHGAYNIVNTDVFNANRFDK